MFPKSFDRLAKAPEFRASDCPLWKTNRRKRLDWPPGAASIHPLPEPAVMPITAGRRDHVARMNGTAPGRHAEAPAPRGFQQCPQGRATTKPDHPLIERQNISPLPGPSGSVRRKRKVSSAARRWWRPPASKINPPSGRRTTTGRYLNQSLRKKCPCSGENGGPSRRRFRASHLSVSITSCGLLGAALLTQQPALQRPLRTVCRGLRRACGI